MSLLDELLQTRRSIAALEATESALVADIIAANQHKKIGQATYEFEGRKIVIETKENITLDKAMLNQVWHEGLPINRAYSYTPRTKELNAALMHGTPEVRKLLASLVTTKPAKPVIRVEG